MLARRRNFAQQFELVRSLNHLEGVVKVLSLEKYRNSVFIVFEASSERAMQTASAN